MLRPRESRDLRLMLSDVTVTPHAVVTWAHDVFGNAVATATFQTMTDRLVIDSVAELELNAMAVRAKRHAVAEEVDNHVVLARCSTRLGAPLDSAILGRLCPC